jgi:hypothetical protein
VLSSRKGVGHLVWPLACQRNAGESVEVFAHCGYRFFWLGVASNERPDRGIC